MPKRKKSSRSRSKLSYQPMSKNWKYARDPSDWLKQERSFARVDKRIFVSVVKYFGKEFTKQWLGIDKYHLWHSKDHKTPQQKAILQSNDPLVLLIFDFKWYHMLACGKWWLHAKFQSYWIIFSHFSLRIPVQAICLVSPFEAKGDTSERVHKWPLKNKKAYICAVNFDVWQSCCLIVQLQVQKEHIWQKWHISRTA